MKRDKLHELCKIMKEVKKDNNNLNEPHSTFNVDEPGTHLMNLEWLQQIK
jgi:hypothetical protein